MPRLLLALPLALALAACQAEVPAAPPAPATPAPEPVAAGAPDVAATPVRADLPVVTLYKTPTCGCCRAWGEHLRSAGFRVETVDLDDLSPIKQEHGIPAQAQSCHTGVVRAGDRTYAIEGHVPAADVIRLLDERPDAAGLAVPGMPVGSPGMEQGDRRDPYEVLLVAESGSTSVFARH